MSNLINTQMDGIPAATATTKRQTYSKPLIAISEVEIVSHLMDTSFPTTQHNSATPGTGPMPTRAGIFMRTAAQEEENMDATDTH